MAGKADDGRVFGARAALVAVSDGLLTAMMEAAVEVQTGRRPRMVVATLVSKAASLLDADAFFGLFLTQLVDTSLGAGLVRQWFGEACNALDSGRYQCACVCSCMCARWLFVWERRQRWR